MPWTRTGPTNKNHCISILSALLGRVKDVADFDFWYLYMSKHIFPQLYHGCTCNNGKLVGELYSDDQKHECLVIYLLLFILALTLHFCT